MEVTGMLYGAKLREFAGFLTAEVLGPDVSEEDIKTLIEAQCRPSARSTLRLPIRRGFAHPR